MLCFLTFNKECSKHTTLAMLALLGLLLLGAEPSSQADLESGAEMCIKGTPYIYGLRHTSSEMCTLYLAGPAPGGKPG